MSTTRSSRPPRDALTSTTSGPATFSRNHSPASAVVSTWRVLAVLAADLDERVVEPLGARTDHEHDVDPEPVGEEARPARCSSTLVAAELAHLPQHGDRASATEPIRARVSRAARIESGLAL